MKIKIRLFEDRFYTDYEFTIVEIGETTNKELIELVQKYGFNIEDYQINTR